MSERLGGSGGVSRVFDADDITLMRTAYAMVVAEEADNAQDQAETDGEIVARAVIRLYSMGMADAGKLSEAARLMTSSRLFRR